MSIEGVRAYDSMGLGGGTWEAVLRHPTIDLPSSLRLHQALQNWATPSEDRIEKRLSVQDPEGEEEVEAEVGHRRLLACSDSAFQINLYLDHPLSLPPESRYTHAKVWVEAEQTMVILPQHAAWSGDLYQDISNFFRYRRLIKALASILRPTRFAWGEHAEGWPETDWLKLDSLDFEDALWRLFVANSWELHLSATATKSLESEFRQAARTELLGRE